MKQIDLRREGHTFELQRKDSERLRLSSEPMEENKGKKRNFITKINFMGKMFIILK